MARVAAVAGLMAGATTATVAHAQPLTARQCADDPFATPVAAPSQALTHREVIGELTELEAVGYSPSEANSGDFPGDVRRARRRLAREYRRDCGQSQAMNRPMSQPARAR